MLAANNVMAKNAGPGAWNDLDPVMIGAGIEGQLSVPEARSLFTLFAAVKAPLLLGSDPSRMGAEYLDIAKNAEVIQRGTRILISLCDSLMLGGYQVPARTLANPIAR